LIRLSVYKYLLHPILKMKLAYVSITVPEDHIKLLCQLTGKMAEHLVKHGITFEPMAGTEIHMTLAFIGHKLQSQSKDKLMEIYEAIEVFNGKLCDEDFEFTQYDYFPLTKRNLFVARYQPSKSGLQKIKELKLKLHSMGFLDEDLKDDFAAHITLGKILSKDRYIFDWEEFRNQIRKVGNFRSHGCHLRGWNPLI
jgi:2'-5' RNA ligase